MKTIRPKKSLGQHFLTDHNIARKIVNSLDYGKCGNILELGPGKGILTTYLKKLNNTRLKLIEIDISAVNYLTAEFPELKEQIIHDDFLKIAFHDIWAEPFLLIGNFPYNISSQILFKVLDYRNQVPQVVCMIQKEVAERIVSGPGTKAYGILSVLLQTFYDINILFTVSEKVFYPPPKVQSAVILLNRNEREKLPCDEKLFLKIVKTSFNQRRKMLRNSLKSILLPLYKDHPMLTKRPEQLGIEDFIILTQLAELILKENN